MKNGWKTAVLSAAIGSLVYRPGWRELWRHFLDVVRGRDGDDEIRLEISFRGELRLANVKATIEKVDPLVRYGRNSLL